MMPELEPIAIPLTVELMVDMIEGNRELIAAHHNIEPDFEIDLESVQKMIDYANEPVIYFDPSQVKTAWIEKTFKPIKP